MSQDTEVDDPDVLLHKDHYRVDELADLLRLDPYVIRVAARTGALGAFVVDHHVLTIRRDAVLRWLRDRA